jgi:hypothetical protein
VDLASSVAVGEVNKPQLGHAKIHNPAVRFSTVECRHAKRRLRRPGFTLRLTDHGRSRLEEKYAASPEILLSLLEWNSASMSWTLVNATVRTDTGKFVSSAWRCETVTRETGGGAGQVWLVVVGLHEVIQMAFPIKERSEKRGKTIKAGKLYDKVQQVNQELMDNDDDALNSQPCRQQ